MNEICFNGEMREEDKHILYFWENQSKGISGGLGMRRTKRSLKVIPTRPGTFCLDECLVHTRYSVSKH